MKYFRCVLWMLSGCTCFWPEVQASQPGSEEVRPNVVMIISDDQAWTDYGFMGHPQIETPNLDALAARSAVFPRGYVPSALCRPSLASMITGLYAHQHGIVGNDPSPQLADPRSPQYAELRESLIGLIDRHPTLPKRLSELGYISHQSGKWWEGSFERGGFTHGMTRGFPHPGGRHGDEGLSIGRQGIHPILEFIDQAMQNRQPFFVWYAPMMPHTPHTPPDRLLDRYVSKGITSTHVARYYAMCQWFDETVGDLVAHIERAGLASQTLFVYIGDNGWIQSPNSPEFAPRSKQSAYEGGVRQPMMLRWDSVIHPKQHEDFVSSIDIVPTILSATGARLPDNLPGRDLMPLVRDDLPLDRDIIFGEGFSHDIADLHRPEASLLYRWAIKDHWKLLLTYDGPPGRHAAVHQPLERRPQLFDLANDPHERHNLAEANPLLVSELADRISEWWPVTERKTITRFEHQ